MALNFPVHNRGGLAANISAIAGASMTDKVAAHSVKAVAQTLSPKEIPILGESQARGEVVSDDGVERKQVDVAIEVDQLVIKTAWK